MWNFAGGARALALLRHGRLEAGEIHLEAALARDVGGQIDREAVRVVELEHGLAVEHPVFAMQRAFEHCHAVFQRLGEALLLLLEHRGHTTLALRQLRVGFAHHAGQVIDEQVEERLLLAQLVAVADRAPDDPAQHVAASFVAGNHAVGDRESCRRGCDRRSP